MKDDLRLMGIATRIFHGRPTDREDAEAIRQATTRFTDRIAALEAKLAEKDALLRSALSQLEYLDDLTGSFPNGSTRATIAKIKDALAQARAEIAELKENPNEG